MAKVTCNMKDCKYRSKRSLRGLRLKSGEKAYGCTLPYITIRHIIDDECRCEAIAGKNEMAVCNCYTPTK